LFASKCPLPLDENGERPRPNDDDIGPKRMSRRYHAFVSFRDERCFARSRRSRRGMPRGSSWTARRPDGTNVHFLDTSSFDALSRR
jgi:hypothetical protein